MSQIVDICDYFISYNSADAAHADAINTALRDAGYSTHFAGTDLPDGANIPIWMDRALARSTQVLALCSPDYFKEDAKYSEVERAAAFWDDPTGVKARLVPVQIVDCDFTPLYAPLKRIDIRGKTADAAAAALIAHLAAGEEAKRREALRAANAHPAIFRVPRPRIPEFTGHEHELARIHAVLSQGQNAAVTQAISGLGGVGKTTLAVEYAHRFGTRGRYGGVWWIYAEAGAVADLAALAEAVGLEEKQNLPEMARDALQWLGGQAQPWLLIYDNVPDPDSVRDWLPAGWARVLITSRFEDFSGLAQTTKLDEWDGPTTIAYLLEQTQRDDTDGATALAGTLDGLPLAANQAAAYLRPRRGISFADYAENIETLIQREKDKGTKGTYPATVYATLITSVEALSEAAQDLMCLLSWLSPDGVEERLLVGAAENVLEYVPDPLGAALRDQLERADLIAEPSALSLLRTAEDPRWGQMLIVHRVVQAVTRAWQRQGNRPGWDGRATGLVNAAFPGGENPATTPSVWETCARLLSHVEALARHGPRSGEPGRWLGRLLNQAGGYHAFARGDIEGAIALFEPNVELARETHGEESEAYAAALSNLSVCYTDVGRYEAAERGILRCLEIVERLFGEDTATIAITLYNLGEVYWKQLQFARAEPLFRRALEIDRRHHGEISLQVARRTNGLASIYDEWAEQPGEAGRRAEAQRLQERALDIARAVRGERHPQVSSYLPNHAVPLARQEDFAAAAELALRASAIMVSLGLTDHPATQRRLDELLHLWDRSGQSDRKKRLWDYLVPEILQVEVAMKAWVEEDPDNRHFGPRSFFEDKPELLEALRAAAEAPDG